MAARAMIKLTLCVGMILTVRGAPQRRDTTKIPLKMPQVSPKVVCVAIFGCYLCQVVFILWSIVFIKLLIYYFLFSLVQKDTYLCHAIETSQKNPTYISMYIYVYTCTVKLVFSSIQHCPCFMSVKLIQICISTWCLVLLKLGTSKHFRNVIEQRIKNFTITCIFVLSSWVWTRCQ